MAAGAIAVAAAMAVQTLAMGRAIAALDVALAIAFAMWVGGGWAANAGERAVVRRYAAGLVAFALHFTEEYVTGFHRALPRLVGYEWTSAQFVAFNASWFAVFVISLFGVRRGVRLAYLPLFFFAVGGGLLNGIGHVALALMRGGYFPGLVTAPLMFAAGVAILRASYAR